MITEEKRISIRLTKVLGDRKYWFTDKQLSKMPTAMRVFLMHCRRDIAHLLYRVGEESTAIESTTFIADAEQSFESRYMGGD